MSLPTITTRPRRPTFRIERFDTVVVGAGQAGLAVGHHLAARDVDFVIVDGADRVGDSWRRRWDSLRLFTPARYSGLPGMPFPAAPDHLPDKDEVADYLERYAERFDLPMRMGTRVRTLGADGDRFVLATGGARLEATSVVVATGAFQRPHVPGLSWRLSHRIHQLHSSTYRNPFELPLGPVLVVGAGNSGAQIAMEIARFRPVWLAGRDTGYTPRRVLGRDVFDWTWPLMTRLTSDTRLGRRLRDRAGDGGESLVGIGDADLVAAGVQRVGRVTDVRDGRPVCDGATLAPSVVIWCTGFTADYSWIDLPVTDARGRLRHRRGVASDAAGLYFVGQRWQHRRTSSLIGGVGADAEWIAAQVAARSEATTPA